RKAAALRRAPLRVPAHPAAPEGRDRRRVLECWRLEQLRRPLVRDERRAHPLHPGRDPRPAVRRDLRKVCRAGDRDRARALEQAGPVAKAHRPLLLYVKRASLTDPRMVTYAPFPCQALAPPAVRRERRAPRAMVPSFEA